VALGDEQLDMNNDSSSARYEEIILCDAPEDEGIVHIKVVAMPYVDPVEFNVAEAREFAQRILAAADAIERGWRK
jgi:hypothetical protein